nr:MAG TPA: hypothetical protein [Caudoviricetes sp.]
MRAYVCVRVCAGDIIRRSFSKRTDVLSVFIFRLQSVYRTLIDNTIVMWYTYGTQGQRPGGQVAAVLPRPQMRLKQDGLHRSGR